MRARGSFSARSSPTCRCRWMSRRAPTAARAPPVSTACPTAAIVAPYRLDARRCIAYLTIEHHSAIPVELRPAIGNRIYGCDDCQLVCPWNKFAHAASHPDFKVRHGLDAARLTELFAWTEAEFEQRMRGSAIYRIGYEKWSRNIAVALGNAPTSAGGDRGAGAAARRVHRRWCASTSTGRFPGTAGALSTSRAPPKIDPGQNAVNPSMEASGSPSWRSASGQDQFCDALFNHASTCRLSISRARPRRAAVSTTRCAVSAPGLLRSSARRTAK